MRVGVGGVRLALVMAAGLLGRSGAARPRVVYVSPTPGRATNPRTATDPVASLPAAPALSRHATANSSADIALARGETFRLQEPQALDHRDSGLTIRDWPTPDNPTPTEPPLISGGYTITKWSRVDSPADAGTAHAPAVWEATIPAEARVLANASSLYISPLTNRTAMPKAPGGDAGHGPNLPSRRYDRTTKV
eukprot:COSAG04_NODE_1970_length_5110_cov_7.302734_2_plen_193_part_00